MNKMKINIFVLLQIYNMDKNKSLWVNFTDHTTPSISYESNGINDVAT